jgi:hypothetical protein
MVGGCLRFIVGEFRRANKRIDAQVWDPSVSQLEDDLLPRHLAFLLLHACFRPTARTGRIHPIAPRKRGTLGSFHNLDTPAYPPSEGWSLLFDMLFIDAVFRRHCVCL